MKSLFNLSFLSALLIFLSACGGGSSSPEQVSEAPVKATVALLLTDASADDYDHAYTTITSVELLGNGGQLIYSGEHEVDLLSLKDTVDLFAVNENVTPGDFTKIRLQASGLTLVVDNEDGSETVTKADLVANGKIDLNPRGPFTIAAGEIVFISLDWDVNESLKLTQTGNGKVNMRPVIFVDIGTRPAFKEGLVRVHGMVELIAEDFMSFRICSPDVATQLPTTPVLGSLCLDIVVNDKTGLFDENGLPIMVDKLMTGDPVTVVGLLRRSSDGPVITPLSDDNGEVAPTPYQVLAIVVEGGPPGTWRKVRGELQTTVDDMSSTFGFLVDARQGYAAGTVLTGKLDPATRLFHISRDTGVTEIVPADLIVGDRAVVDSVYIGPVTTTSSAGTLRIALLLSRAPVATDSVRGEIASIDAAEGTLQLMTAGGEVCVRTDVETRIFEVFVNEDSVESMPVTLAELSVGSQAGATGAAVSTDGCFAADLIIAEGQSVTTQ